MTDPRYSFVFVNFQSSGELALSLASWRKAASNISAEFIVVNNDILEEGAVDRIATDYQASAIHLGANFGFGKACNEGARRARGRLLFFLNPDTRYVGGSLTSLEAVFETHPRSIGGVRLVGEEGRAESWSAGMFPTLLRILLKQFFGAPWQPAWTIKHFSFTDWVSGAALVLPREVFHDLGGFDEGFFLYFEDVDLCRRAVNQGIPTWRYPFVTVLHRGGASQASHVSQKAFYYTSLIRYFAKHRPGRESHVLIRLLQLRKLMA